MERERQGREDVELATEMQTELPWPHASSQDGEHLSVGSSSQVDRNWSLWKWELEWFWYKVNFSAAQLTEHCAAYRILPFVEQSGVCRKSHSERDYQKELVNCVAGKSIWFIAAPDS